MPARDAAPIKASAGYAGIARGIEGEEGSARRSSFSAVKSSLRDNLSALIEADWTQAAPKKSALARLMRLLCSYPALAHIVRASAKNSSTAFPPQVRAM